eukprot:gene4629-843_t
MVSPPSRQVRPRYGVASPPRPPDGVAAAGRSLGALERGARPSHVAYPGYAVVDERQYMLSPSMDGWPPTDGDGGRRREGRRVGNTRGKRTDVRKWGQALHTLVKGHLPGEAHTAAPCYDRAVDMVQTYKRDGSGGYTRNSSGSGPWGCVGDAGDLYIKVFKDTGVCGRSWAGWAPLAGPFERGLCVEVGPLCSLRSWEAAGYGF